VGTSAAPPVPVLHSWTVCLRERGLTLDAQIGRVLERIEPVHARLLGLIPGQDVSAQLVIVCDFDDEEGEDELPDVAATEDRKLLEKPARTASALGLVPHLRASPGALGWVMGCAERSRQIRPCRPPRWLAVPGPDAREPAAGASASW
jgi:hypothetical protein